MFKKPKPNSLLLSVPDAELFAETARRERIRRLIESIRYHKKSIQDSEASIKGYEKDLAALSPEVSDAASE